MTIKVYISGICGSQEVRKQQQRVIFILQGLKVDLQIIDVTDPGRDEDLTFMQEGAKTHGKKTQLPPQIFNENEYCGDYPDFELANDDDEIMKFLKLETGPSKAESLKSTESSGDVIRQNGVENHETEETPTIEEPISNGINHADDEINEQDSELVNNEAEIEENTTNDTPVAEESEVVVEETKEEEVKNENAAKESSEEESEEESE